METTLHRQLKEAYADRDGRLEVPLTGYRIDVVSRGRLIEIQHGSLAAIRDKVRALLRDHHVLVVKPIVAKRWLVRRTGKRGRVLGRRMSPKRGTILELFDELVYFTQVFPHPNLVLEVPMVVIEEWRYHTPGRRSRDYRIEDQKLIEVAHIHRFQVADDLAGLIRCPLTVPFHTGDLAKALNVNRWRAQRIAYCLRQTGALIPVGKQRNTWLYEMASGRTAA
jgi:hypothetical protein